jgi:hypothetical protein
MLEARRLANISQSFCIVHSIKQQLLPWYKQIAAGVAVDLDHREMQSATLGLEIKCVDPDLSQVGGVDPWNSAAVTS